MLRSSRMLIRKLKTMGEVAPTPVKQEEHDAIGRDESAMRGLVTVGEGEEPPLGSLDDSFPPMPPLHWTGAFHNAVHPVEQTDLLDTVDQSSVEISTAGVTSGSPLAVGQAPSSRQT